MDRRKRGRSDDQHEQDGESRPRKQQKGPGRGAALASPWQLTWVRDLPDELNRDAVSLKDLLGDPLISECWEFNFLHDVGFLMDAFDADTRHLVKVHVVHGFWKHEDPNRLALVREAAAFSNVWLHTAPMPEMFGTHHSKMMVLFRRDDTAQVIIHTANMIAKDWTNMTNGVWTSPMLARRAAGDDACCVGARFKRDLLSYLRSYDGRRPTCGPLVEQLAQYDFSGVRAALIASVPGRHDAHDQSGTAWGWVALKRCLQSVPCAPGDAEIAVQVSSIATLGAKDDWLRKTLFGALGKSSSEQRAGGQTFCVVFPTADEVRQSLDGYASGGSIHTKVQSRQQAQQLQYLRRMLCHWANDSDSGRELPAGVERFDGGRNRAAPHIKTYIRFGGDGVGVDWALLTSANLSRQAWGEAARPTGEVRIASWEVGVMVWPALYGEGSVMTATFGTDTPAGGAGREVGLRVPYSMPLQRYGRDETPWVATLAHAEPDRWGRVWAG